MKKHCIGWKVSQRNKQMSLEEICTLYGFPAPTKQKKENPAKSFLYISAIVLTAVWLPILLGRL